MSDLAHGPLVVTPDTMEETEFLRVLQHPGGGVMPPPKPHFRNFKNKKCHKTKLSTNKRKQEGDYRVLCLF